MIFNTIKKTISIFLLILLVAITTMAQKGKKAAPKTKAKTAPKAATKNPSPTPEPSAPPSTIAPTLLADLKSVEAVNRHDAASELGALRNKDAVPFLIPLLTDKEVTVREAAAFALGQITDSRATAALTKMLADKDAEVRASTVFALGMIHDRKIAATISGMLDDPAAAVRSAAATALGVMEDEAAVDELIDLLNDPAYDVRYDAAWALGQIGDADALDHLQASIVAIDSLQVNDASREDFRLQAQNSIEHIKAEQATRTPSRPRKVEGVVDLNKYANVSNPAGIRQTVKAIATSRAIQSRINGAVRLKVLVAADGRPARAYVLKRLGYGLDLRAIEAALQYKFEPAMLSGLPQTGYVFIDVQF